MRKFDPNHDEKGRFSGGASLRQGTGKAPVTHTQTRGEKWYRMGAKDPVDAEMLARKHAGADYHAKAYAAIHDPSNPEHRIKLSDLQAKAEGLADQLAAAQPNQADTTRTFKQHVPKRGKVKHTKLMADLVKHIHETKDSALNNGKEHGLIPADTNPKVATKAYHHGALIALHRSGVGEYDFNMSPEDKVHMKPLKKFIMYTHRRLFDEFHSKHKGEFKVYHDQFGKPFEDKRTDKDGNERKRFSPMHEVVKFETGDLQKMLPEYDRACAMAHSYGPKLLQSIKKELKSSIKESETEAAKVTPQLTKGIGSVGVKAAGIAASGAASIWAYNKSGEAGVAIHNKLFGTHQRYQPIGIKFKRPSWAGQSNNTQNTNSQLNKGIGSWIGGAIGGLAGGAATDGVGAEEGASIGSKIGGGVGDLLSGAKEAFKGSRASQGIGAVIRGAQKVAASKPAQIAGKTFNAVGDVAKHPFERTLGTVGKLGGAKFSANAAKVGSHVDSVNDIAAVPIEVAAANDEAKKAKQPKQAAM